MFYIIYVYNKEAHGERYKQTVYYATGSSEYVAAQRVIEMYGISPNAIVTSYKSDMIEGIKEKTISAFTLSVVLGAIENGIFSKTDVIISYGNFK